MRILTSCFVAVLCGACGVSVPVHQLDDYQIVAKNDAFTTTLDKIAGTGKVLFSTPFGSLSSDKSYELQFRLEEGGVLRIDSHANTDRSLGVDILLGRSGALLTASLYKGSTETDITEALSSYDASSNMRMYIDVQNSQTPARVLIWAVRSRESSEALLDTSAGVFSSPGRGEGLYWALEMSKASVTYARASNASALK